MEFSAGSNIGSRNMLGESDKDKIPYEQPCFQVQPRPRMRGRGCGETTALQTHYGRRMMAAKVLPSTT